MELREERPPREEGRSAAKQAGPPPAGPGGDLRCGAPLAAGPGGRGAVVGGAFLAEPPGEGTAGGDASASALPGRR